jgi:hypothetical protein
MLKECPLYGKTADLLVGSHVSLILYKAVIYPHNRSV